MNKKAFTMVELLAVITIICLIGLVSVPAVTNLTEQMDEKEYQRYLKDLYLATETYIGLRSADFLITKTDSGLTIKTYGYGHGVGMSQYGAQGMAQAGYNYKQIITHYYNGVSIVKS